MARRSANQGKGRTRSARCDSVLPMRSGTHGSAEVLARLARGEDVDAGEYTFRTSTQIETAAPECDWLNKGVFISVSARPAADVIYETYLVE